MTFSEKMDGVPKCADCGGNLNYDPVKQKPHE